MVTISQGKVSHHSLPKGKAQNQSQAQSQQRLSTATMSGNTKDAKILDYKNTNDVSLLRERIAQLEQQLADARQSNTASSAAVCAQDIQGYEAKLATCRATISNLQKENEILLQELESAHSNIQSLVVKQTQLKNSLIDYEGKKKIVKEEVESSSSNDENDNDDGIQFSDADSERAPGTDTETENNEKEESTYTRTSATKSSNKKRVKKSSSPPPTIEDCKLLIDKMDKFYKLQQETATDIIRDYQLKFIESSQLLQQKNQLILQLEQQIKDMLMIQEQQEQEQEQRQQQQQQQQAQYPSPQATAETTTTTTTIFPRSANLIYIKLYNDLSSKHETLQNSYLILSYKFQQMFNDLTEYKNVNMKNSTNTKNTNVLKIVKLEKMLIDKSNELELFMMNNPSLIKDKLIDSVTTTNVSEFPIDDSHAETANGDSSNGDDNDNNNEDSTAGSSAVGGLNTSMRKRRFEIVGMKNDYRSKSSGSETTTSVHVTSTTTSDIERDKKKVKLHI